jgi:hypothetical protein
VGSGLVAEITDLDEFRRRSRTKPSPAFIVREDDDDVVIFSPGPVALLDSIAARKLAHELIDTADMIEGFK